MTRVIVGTYRAKHYIEQCLRSIDERLIGVSDIVFVDDSGDDRHCDWLETYGKVHRLNQEGYVSAYSTICYASNLKSSFVMEEDFVITRTVDLDELQEILFNRPYLAQIALIRNAVYAPEREAGGLIEHLSQTNKFVNVFGVLEHTAVFTCNPSLWRGDVFRSWPQFQSSERIKRDELRASGYRFGFLPGERCFHSGERSGYGY